MAAVPLASSSRRSVSASRRSAALWNRSLGSFSRHRQMIRSRSRGASGFTSVSFGGSSRRIDVMSERPVSPSKGRVPVAISYRSTPKEKRSDRASTWRPSACSGDM